MAGFAIEIGSDLLSKGVNGQDVVVALHDATPELADIELYNVTARTPFLTGALAADITADPTTDPDSTELLHIYSGEANQDDEYNRVYVQYQEGGELGAGSNNGSGDNEMYFKVTTDDLPEIEDWALRAVQAALDTMFGGTS